MSYDALLFDNDGVLLERTGGDRSTFEAAVRTAFSDPASTRQTPNTFVIWSTA